MAQFYSFFGSLIRFFELELKDKMLFESVNGSQSTDHSQWQLAIKSVFK